MSGLPIGIDQCPAKAMEVARASEAVEEAEARVQEEVSKAVEEAEKVWAAEEMMEWRI